MEETIPLRRIRESIHATREDLIKQAQNLSIGTLRNAERGNNIRYDSAKAILEALNKLLQEANRDTVKLDDLGLNIH